MILSSLPRWLLDEVAEIRLELTALARDPETLQEYLNRVPIAPFDPDQLAGLLVECVRAGWFDLRAADGHIITSISIDQIRRAIWDRVPFLELGFTAAGGQAWEDLAHPDWSRYVNYAATGLPEDETLAELVVEASSRELLDQVLARLDCLGYDLAAGSARVAAVTPWEPTYWKTLPRGERLQCLVREQSDPPDRPRDPPAWYAQPRAWYS